MSEPFKTRGGVWVHGAWLSWPFAAFEVHDDFLRVFACVYPHDERLKLFRRRGLFGSGLGLEHPKWPDKRPFVFWPIGFEALRAALAARGYAIDESRLRPDLRRVRLLAPLTFWTANIGWPSRLSAGSRSDKKPSDIDVPRAGRAA